jgi:hypothetical protein
MITYKVNDRVRILRKDIRHLDHRRDPVYGRIISVDGEYVMVKPSWCRWEIELYKSEIALI